MENKNYCFLTFFHSLNEDTKIYLFDYEDVDKFENEKELFAKKLNASGYSWKITKKFISNLPKLEIEKKLLGYLEQYDGGKYTCISALPSDSHDKFLMSFLKTILKSYIIANTNVDSYCIHENLEDANKYGILSTIGNEEKVMISKSLKSVVNLKFVENECNCEYVEIKQHKGDLVNAELLEVYNGFLKKLENNITEKMMLLGEQHCKDIAKINKEKDDYESYTVKNNKIAFMNNYNIAFLENIEDYNCVSLVEDAHNIIKKLINKCTENNENIKYICTAMCSKAIFELLKLKEYAKELNINAIQELQENDDRLLFIFSEVKNGNLETDKLLNLNISNYISIGSASNDGKSMYRLTYEINENENTTKNNFAVIHIRNNNKDLQNIIQQIPILSLVQTDYLTEKNEYEPFKSTDTVKIPSEADKKINLLNELTIFDKNYYDLIKNNKDNLAYNKTTAEGLNSITLDKLFELGWTQNAIACYGYSDFSENEKTKTEINNFNISFVKKSRKLSPEYSTLIGGYEKIALNCQYNNYKNKSQADFLAEHIEKMCEYMDNPFYQKATPIRKKFIITNNTIGRILANEKMAYTYDKNNITYHHTDREQLYYWCDIIIPCKHSTQSYEKIQLYIDPNMKENDTRLLLGYSERCKTRIILNDNNDKVTYNLFSIFNNSEPNDYITIYIDLIEDETKNNLENEENINNSEYFENKTNDKSTEETTTYTLANEPVPGISYKLSDDINLKWTKFLPEVYKYMYNAIPSNVRNTIDSAAAQEEINDKKQAIDFLDKCGYSIYRDEGAEIRYFQHIDPSEGDLFLTITELKDIKNENSENIYYFEDGTYYREIVVGKVNEVSAFMHKPIVEISDKLNFWKIKKYELEVKTVKDTHGVERTAKEYFTEHTPDITYIYNIPRVVGRKIEIDKIFSNSKKTENKNNVNENISKNEDIQEISKIDNDNLVEQINDIKNILKTLKEALGKLNI